MKRFCRVAGLVLAAVMLLSVPGAQAKYKKDFGFGFNDSGAVGLNNSQANSAENINNVSGKNGFNVVWSANHFFDVWSDSTATQTDTKTRIFEVKREGYYAFVIRGGDGGAGRRRTLLHGRGGAGGMVMGYLKLEAGTKLYIEIGTAGLGYNSEQKNVAAHWGGGINGAGNNPRGGNGGGCTILATSDQRGAAVRNSNIIALAGGGGGGGGIHDTNDGNVFKRHRSNGGHAGGARDNVAVTKNLPLNGYDIEQGNGVVPVTGGLVSPGVRAGDPKATGTTKDTARNPYSSSNGQSGYNGGGGGGATEEGKSGSSTNSTGNGASYGGGPAVNDQGGGGGGGSSFVRNDVVPLTQEMLGSAYFSPFYLLNNDTSGDNADATAAPRYGNHTNRNTTRRISTAVLGGSTAALSSTSNITSGILLQAIYNLPGDSAISSTFGIPHDNGWSGFAFIKYLGPVDPAKVTAANSYGWPF